VSVARSSAGETRAIDQSGHATTAASVRAVDTTRSRPALVDRLAAEFRRVAAGGGLGEPEAVATAPTLLGLSSPADLEGHVRRVIGDWQRADDGSVLAAALLPSKRMARALEKRLAAVARGQAQSPDAVVALFMEVLSLQLAWALFDLRSRAGGGREHRPGRPVGVAGPNVMICGYTAAGKTTHALLLSQELGYDYVSASSVLVDKLDSSRDASWRTRRRVLGAKRSEGADLNVDRTLAVLARTRSGIVFDAWALPFLSIDAPKLSVWLEASESDRARKCRCSQQFGKNPMGAVDCRKLVARIDNEARERFTSMYRVDYDDVRNTVDLAIDCSGYLRRPDLSAAIRGVREFHPLFSATVREALQV
jgi:cytidylate kinase